MCSYTVHVPICNSGFHTNIIFCSADKVRSPHGLAYDSSNAELPLLYVAEHGLDRISALEPITGQIVRTIQTGGAALKMRLRPDGVALDNFGNILVTDSESNRLVVFDLDSGTLLSSFTTEAKPRSVAVDVEGNVVVGGHGFLWVW